MFQRPQEGNTPGHMTLPSCKGCWEMPCPSLGWEHLPPVLSGPQKTQRMGLRKAFLPSGGNSQKHHSPGEPCVQRKRCGMKAHLRCRALSTSPGQGHLSGRRLERGHQHPLVSGPPVNPKGPSTPTFEEKHRCGSLLQNALHLVLLRPLSLLLLHPVCACDPY